MEIDLGAPGFVKIVSVAENGFVAKIDVYCAEDELVMLCIIAGFEKRLWIDMTVR